MAPHRWPLLLFVVSLAAPVAAENPVTAAQVYAAYKGAVLRVTATGELFNHEKEVSTGSGFVFLRSGLAVTSNHVVFTKPDNYQAVSITVSIGRNAESTVRQATVVARDAVHDVAILQLDGPAPAVVALGESSAVAIGDDISVMGFPLQCDLSIVRGLLSSQPAPDKWQTDSALNPGNSGGPVFSPAGKVVGIVSSGIVLADGLAVEGIKFFLPIDSVKPLLVTAAGPLVVESIGRSPASDGAVASAADGAGAIVRGGARGASRGRGMLPIDVQSVAPSETFSRAFQVSQLQDTHSLVAPTVREYSFDFKADDGYDIVGTQLVEMSANFVTDKDLRVVDEGRRAVLRFSLRSGPMWDQYRAWFHATVVAEQRRRPALGRVPPT